MTNETISVISDTATTPQNSRVRFSVLHLLIATTYVAVGIGIFRWHWQRGEREVIALWEGAFVVGAIVAASNPRKFIWIGALVSGLVMYVGIFLVMLLSSRDFSPDIPGFDPLSPGVLSLSMAGAAVTFVAMYIGRSLHDVLTWRRTYRENARRAFTSLLTIGVLILGGASAIVGMLRDRANWTPRWQTRVDLPTNLARIVANGDNTRLSILASDGRIHTMQRKSETEPFQVVNSVQIASAAEWLSYSREANAICAADRFGRGIFFVGIRDDSSVRIWEHFEPSLACRWLAVDCVDAGKQFLGVCETRAQDRAHVVELLTWNSGQRQVVSRRTLLRYEEHIDRPDATNVETTDSSSSSQSLDATTRERFHAAVIRGKQIIVADLGNVRDHGNIKVHRFSTDNDKRGVEQEFTSPSTSTAESFLVNNVDVSDDGRYIAINEWLFDSENGTTVDLPGMSWRFLANSSMLALTSTFRAEELDWEIPPSIRYAPILRWLFDRRVTSRALLFDCDQRSVVRRSAEFPLARQIETTEDGSVLLMLTYQNQIFAWQN